MVCTVLKRRTSRFTCRLTIVEVEFNLTPFDEFTHLSTTECLHNRYGTEMQKITGFRLCAIPPPFDTLIAISSQSLTGVQAVVQSSKYFGCFSAGVIPTTGRFA